MLAALLHSYDFKCLVTHWVGQGFGLAELRGLRSCFWGLTTSIIKRSPKFGQVTYSWTSKANARAPHIAALDREVCSRHVDWTKTWNLHCGSFSQGIHALDCKRHICIGEDIADRPSTPQTTFQAPLPWGTIDHWKGARSLVLQVHRCAGKVFGEFFFKSKCGRTYFCLDQYHLT